MHGKSPSVAIAVRDAADRGAARTAARRARTPGVPGAVAVRAPKSVVRSGGREGDARTRA